MVSELTLRKWIRIKESFRIFWVEKGKPFYWTKHKSYRVLFILILIKVCLRFPLRDHCPPTWFHRWMRTFYIFVFSAEYVLLLARDELQSIGFVSEPSIPSEEVRRHTGCKHYRFNSGS